MYTPVNPNFTILKWGVRGSSLHGHVIMMPTALIDLLKMSHDDDDGPVVVSKGQI